MDVQPDYAVNETESNEVVVPNFVGMTYSQAKELAQNSGFGINTSSEFSEDTVITNQVPKYGAALTPGSNIMTYKEEDQIQKTNVPDVRNMSVAVATATFRNLGLNVRVEGSGYVLTQDVSAGEQIDMGSIVTIKCIDDLNGLP